MEEGVLIENPSQSSHYYCYMCAEEVRPIYPDLTCPTCLNGFIEELPESDSDENHENQDLEGVNPAANPNTGYFGGIGVYHGYSDAERDEMEDLLRDTLQNELLPLQGVADVSLAADYILQDLRSSGLPEGSSQPGSSEQQRTASDIVWDIMQLYLEFHQFTDDADSFEMDAQITRLLNETDYSVSQPLPKEIVEEIPLISLEKVHIEKSCQCAICMEDFKVEDLAKCLPCEHLYHEVCIVPWFERNSTCPICRQSLAPDSTDDKSSDPTSSSTIESSDSDATRRDSARYSRRSSVPGNLDANLGLLSLDHPRGATESLNSETTRRGSSRYGHRASVSDRGLLSLDHSSGATESLNSDTTRRGSSRYSHRASVSDRGLLSLDRHNRS